MTTTTGSLGARICGMRVYKVCFWDYCYLFSRVKLSVWNSVYFKVDKGCFDQKDKHWGKSLSPAQFCEGLEQFFNNGRSVSNPSKSLGWQECKRSRLRFGDSAENSDYFKDFVFWIGLVGRKISVYRRRVRRRLVPHFIKRLREIQVHSNGKEHSDQEWT